MRNCIYISALALIVGTPALQASDSLNILTRHLLHNNQVISLQSDIYSNPATKPQMQLPGIVYISFDANNYNWGTSSLCEDGSSNNLYRLSAETLIKGNNDILFFGDASYCQGNRTNVKWNEVADAQLLSPYLVADSIGGNIQHQNYSFSGGYAISKPNWNWGMSASCKAGLECRQSDPRPKNRTLNTKIDFGLSRKLFNSYFAVKLHFGKYDQRSSIDCYGALGSVSIYHLTGLGSDYARFAGDLNKTQYKGWEWGGGASFQNTSDNRLFLTFDYNGFRVKKLLTGINNTPISQLFKTDIDFTAGYYRTVSNITFGAVLKSRTALKFGDENLFNNTSGQDYRQIGSQQYYTQKRYLWSVNTFAANRTDQKIHWQIMPAVSLFKSLERHKLTSRNIEFTNIDIKLAFLISTKIGKSLLSFSPYLAHCSNTSKQLHDFGIPSKSRYDALHHNYQFLTSNHTDWQLASAILLPLNANQAILLSAKWQHKQFKHSSNADETSLAVTFCY